MQSGSFFEGLDDATIAELDRGARRMHFELGDVLFNRGDVAPYVHALISGHIKISRPMADGGDRVLMLLGPGDVIGSLAVVQDAVQPVTAIAIGPVEATAWPAAHFRDVVVSNPLLAERALHLVARRAEQMLDLLEEYASIPLDQRLARVLLRIALECGRECSDDCVTFRVTRQDLAELTSVTLPTVSRLMSRWRREGLIAGNRGEVIIKSLPRLAQLADVSPDSALD